MSRTLTSAVNSAIAADNVPLVAFVELDFGSGFVRVTTAGYDIAWNSYTWTGLGDLASIEAIGESTEFFAHGVSMQLSGIPPSMVTRARTEHYQGRAARIWLALLGANYNVLADPYLAWVGRMDVMAIQMGATASIGLTTETRFADWDRPRTRLYSDADQQAEFSGDSGFRYLEQLVEKTITWGAPGSPVATAPKNGDTNSLGTGNIFNPTNTPPARPATGVGSDRPYG
jgi:hypothetical protein